MHTLLKGQLSWLLISLSVITCANAVEQEQATLFTWQDFKSDGGHFSIQFPSAPKTQTNHQDSVIGQVTNHIIVSHTDNSNFGVDYSDLPGFALEFVGKDTIYSHATGALLKKTLGMLRSSIDLNFQGQTGKHLIYDIPPVPDKPALYGEAYMFLIDKRLYVIDATAPADTSTQVHHFLNSLRFD